MAKNNSEEIDFQQYVVDRVSETKGNLMEILYGSNARFVVFRYQKIMNDQFNFTEGVNYELFRYG